MADAVRGKAVTRRVELSRRRAVFRALVGLQDRGLSVAESRLMVGERFGLSEADVLAVEAEGVRKEWPPL